MNCFQKENLNIINLTNSFSFFKDFNKYGVVEKIEIVCFKKLNEVISSFNFKVCPFPNFK